MGSQVPVVSYALNVSPLLSAGVYGSPQVSYSLHCVSVSPPNSMHLHWYLVFSAGLQWSPMVTTGHHGSPSDSTGVYWTLLVSTCPHWSLRVSTVLWSRLLLLCLYIHWSPMVSNSLPRSPQVFADLLSYPISLLDSAGLHWCLWMSSGHHRSPLVSYGLLWSPRAYTGLHGSLHGLC